MFRLEDTYSYKKIITPRFLVPNPTVKTIKHVAFFAVVAMGLKQKVASIRKITEKGYIFMKK